MFNQFKKIFSQPTLDLTSAGLSDIGRVRKNNEDCYTILDDKNIFIVADGMGGHNGGEVASKATIEIMQHFYSNKVVKAMRNNPQETRHAMLNSFEKANSVVMDLAEEDKKLFGMGCTLIIAFINGNTLYTCHVGDTRCYLISGKKIKRLTSDHTMTEESPDSSHNRHVVTRVIGYPFPEPPEYNTTSLQAGDRILLCSDGLWSMVDDSEIIKHVSEAAVPKAAVKNLINSANKAGGDDNITALAIFC